MDKSTLKKLHESEVKVLDEIVRVCNNNDLRYFLMGGTLLGSIRHKGFIPWDDDLDIAMPREDYEKFLEIAPKELCEDFELDDISINKKYWLIFAKVRLKNSHFTEKNYNKKYNGPDGIWVDIFPIDYTTHKGDFFINKKGKMVIDIITKWLRKRKFLYLCLELFL